MRSIRIWFKVLLTMWIISLITLICSCRLAQNQHPDSPLTLERILTSLQSQAGDSDSAQKNKGIIADTKKYGVNFTLTPKIESTLRIAGANDELINAIREKSPQPETSKTDSDKLNVSVAFWKKQRDKARENRNGPVGIKVKELLIPTQLQDDGVVKETAKLRKMIKDGYKMPMDFADLARRLRSGELVELPMATDNYVISVGGSTTKREFTSFDFERDIKPPTIKPGSDDYIVLAKLASDFPPEKYDLSDPEHRRKMKIRLLRTLHPQAKIVLERIASEYRQKFDRPLIIISLTRSMEYQISLNKFNPNSFKVKGPESLPPHLSSYSFDISYSPMDADEQRFMLSNLAELEKNGIIDALRVEGLAKSFHVFVLSGDGALSINKSYQAMSANEKSKFINSETAKILNGFGRMPGDKISNEGLKKIKSFVDKYVKRISDDDDKTTGREKANEINTLYDPARSDENLVRVLKRGSRFSPVIREAFERNDLQPEIGIYIAMIESEFIPCFQSPTGPLGMFLFTRATGRAFGLETKRGASPQNPDDRCNPKLASQAAAAYLRKLIDKDFSNDAIGILLSIAAYNAGEGGIKANIRKTREAGNREQIITFWTLMKNKEKLSKQFQSQNVNYVPMFFAAAIIGDNPQVFGIKDVPPLSKVN